MRTLGRATDRSLSNRPGIIVLIGGKAVGAGVVEGD